MKTKLDRKVSRAKVDWLGNPNHWIFAVSVVLGLALATLGYRELVHRREARERARQDAESTATQGRGSIAGSTGVGFDIADPDYAAEFRVCEPLARRAIVWNVGDTRSLISISKSKHIEGTPVRAFLYKLSDGGDFWSVLVGPAGVIACERGDGGYRRFLAGDFD